MFEPSSRYNSLAVKTITVIAADGEPREIRYVERRFLPPPDMGTTLVEHVVSQGDRLDNVTGQYLGDPEQFWRLCDANNAMQPDELTGTVGRVIRITLPEGIPAPSHA